MFPADRGPRVPYAVGVHVPAGVNLPWMRYGGDFGANAWSPAGGLSTRADDELPRTLEAASRAGARVVRWFVLCDGRAGFESDAHGPVRLQPVVLDDFGAALDALAAHGLRMVPTLFDFTWTNAGHEVNGVQIGGRAALLRDPVARHRVWRALDALLTAFGHHPAIAMWDVWNEPEWMCAPWRAPHRRLGRRLVRQLLAEVVLHVRWHSPHPVTVGLASARGLPLVRHLDLDVLQVHWYDHLERRAPLVPCPRVPWRTAPVVLGEFPTRGSRRDPVTLPRLAREAGYAAAWAWSLRADDGSTDADAALAALAADDERT